MPIPYVPNVISVLCFQQNFVYLFLKIDFFWIFSNIFKHLNLEQKMPSESITYPSYLIGLNATPVLNTTSPPRNTNKTPVKK